MKFFHVSDLHIGKRIGNYSTNLIEDQTDVLTKIVALAKEEQPDAILIAGDVYDKPMPTIEAVQLLDRFLVWLNELGISIFLISGNHDSIERMAFGAELMKSSNVHIVQTYNGEMQPAVVSDAHGEVQVWMLPHLRPSSVRKHHPNTNINSCSDAVAAALGNAVINTNKRNVLVAHQFVTGSITCDSEEIVVGDSENVDAALFDAFDYVALGHIHRPQHIKRETLRYSGTPLMYSLSEADHTKSVTVVEMESKGKITISELPLELPRVIREVRGTYEELMSRANYRDTNIDDLVHIVLTNEQEEPDAIAKLRNVYPHILNLRYDNQRTQAVYAFETSPTTAQRTPVDLFSDFFENQHGGRKLSAEQSEYVSAVFGELKEAMLS